MGRAPRPARGHGANHRDGREPARIAQESQAWKSTLSTWRLIVAAMPERVELQAPFAFMQAYMSVTRSTPPPQTRAT